MKLETIQNELSAILGKYPECHRLEYYPQRKMFKVFHTKGHSGMPKSLTEVIEHLKTKYPNR